MKPGRLNQREHPTNPGSRSTMPRRTKYMNRESANKKRERRDTDKLRKLVRTDPVTGEPVACCICGDNPATQTHEITCGTHARAKAVYRPRIQLPTCGDCNKFVLTNYDEWPIERQLAVAVLLLIQEANECRGRAPSAITWRDVEQWL